VEFSGYDDRGSVQQAERWMSALHTPILNEKERFRPWKQGLRASERERENELCVLKRNRCF